MRANIGFGVRHLHCVHVGLAVSLLERNLALRNLDCGIGGIVTKCEALWDQQFWVIALKEVKCDKVFKHKMAHEQHVLAQCHANERQE